MFIGAGEGDQPSYRESEPVTLVGRSSIARRVVRSEDDHLAAHRRVETAVPGLPDDGNGRGVHVLYVCYFGLEEPLVQSQVLPYLRELARSGVRMSLLTFEPDLERRWTPASIAERKEQLEREGIHWHLLPYHKRPALPATLWDVAAGVCVATRIARRDGVQIFHGRSHVGAAIGLVAKRMTSARVVFDIRGFLAEEYVDKGRWKAGGCLFRLVKAAERWLYRSADGFVVLTVRARETLFPSGPPDGRPIELIPCCVDPLRFAGLSACDRDEVRARLGVSARLVFIHAGTVGGAYLTREAAAFLAAARAADARTYALVLTQGTADPLVTELEAAGFSRADYRVVHATPGEVPRYMNAADVGLALLRPSFARRSASPAKFAEYLAAGLPVVVTADIGDLDTDIDENRVGVRLRDFDRDACLATWRELEQLRRDPDLGARCRDLSRARYDLQTVGGPRYRRLYNAILTSASR